MKTNKKRLKFAREQNRKRTPAFWIEQSEICLIYPGVIICPQGFGYEWDDNFNEYVHINHTGKLIISDNVVVHENTTLVRGTSDNSETFIGEGTKIDCHCHIGHNVKIGKNCIIAANTSIGGSTEIGDNVYIANGVTIRNKIKICDNANIGTGAVVVKNIDIPDVWYIGNPAKSTP